MDQNAFGAAAKGSVNAQQQAVLQKMEVPGSGFDIVIATPKSGGAIYDLSESPDALVIHLIGGELVLGFDAPKKMLGALESVRSPVGAFHAVSKDGKSLTPFAVFVVPRDDE